MKINFSSGALPVLLFVFSTSTYATPRLDVEAVTDVPISMGVNLASHWPHGIRASTGLGFTPSAYIALINEVVQSFPDTYDDATGDLIEETLKDALIWRTHVGWQMDCGVYFDAGYTLSTLGGGTSTQALLAALTDREEPPNDRESIYSVASTLHMLDAEVGYLHVFENQWTARVAIGVSATVASSTQVSADEQPRGDLRRRAVRAFEQYAEDYLNETYTSFVHTPVVTIALGHRFY